MTKSPRQHNPKPLVNCGGRAGNKKAATVASTGVQARLVRTDSERERKIEGLIASCEALRAAWDHLFQEVIDCLNEEEQGTRDSLKRPHPLARDGGCHGVR